MPEGERSAAARRRAAMVPLLVLPPAVIPTLVRQRHDLGEIILKNHVVLEQLVLVLAGCIALAAVGFGVKAWHDAKASR